MFYFIFSDADGNPVTGEGYDVVSTKSNITNNQQLTNGGSASSVPNTNVASPPPSAPAPTRQRIPPGGFSSGLW